MYPTVPDWDENFARIALSGVNAIEPIIPTIFASPTIGWSVKVAHFFARYGAVSLRTRSTSPSDSIMFKLANATAAATG